MCAWYTITFLVLGALLVQEMWHDRERELLYDVSPLRQVSCVSIFFIAAVIFGALTWILFPV